VPEVKDVTVPEPNPALTTAPEPAGTPVDADAAEIGRIILESGFSKEQINQLLEAPGALQAMKYQIESDPVEFLRTLSRSNPQLAQKFQESLVDDYVAKYAPKDTPPKAGGRAPAQDSALMDEVADLREKLNSVTTEREREKHLAAMAQVKARYDARVDDLFNQLPQGLNLTKAESKALRAQLQAELSEDPQAVQRVSNGNFVDVPRKFQSLVEGWAKERKDAADAEKAKRERASKLASPEFTNGAVPVDLSAFTDVKQKSGPNQDYFDDPNVLGDALSKMGSL
jgi:hypothetical protein